METNKKNYLAIAEELQRQYSNVLIKAHKECVSILRKHGLRIDFNEEDTDYDVTIYDCWKICSLRAAYLPSENTDSIILELYRYNNKQTYTTNYLNTDLLPTNLLTSLAAKISEPHTIEDCIGRYVYQVEEYCGQKEIHVDGYIYWNDDHYDLVQACGCIVPIELLKSKTEEGINDIVKDAFSNVKQYQGEINAEQILSYYNPKKNKPLAFYEVNENTPCGFYVA